MLVGQESPVWLPSRKLPRHWFQSAPWVGSVARLTRIKINPIQMAERNGLCGRDVISKLTCGSSIATKPWLFGWTFFNRFTLLLNFANNWFLSICLVSILSTFYDKLKHKSIVMLSLVLTGSSKFIIPFMKSSNISINQTGPLSLLSMTLQMSPLKTNQILKK